jgi:hypothetical protein
MPVSDSEVSETSESDSNERVENIFNPISNQAAEIFCFKKKWDSFDFPRLD